MAAVGGVAEAGVGGAQCALCDGDYAGADGACGFQLAAAVDCAGRVCGAGGGGVAVYKMKGSGDSFAALGMTIEYMLNN